MMKNGLKKPMTMPPIGNNGMTKPMREMEENYEDGYYTYFPEEHDLGDEHYAEAEQ